MEALIAIALLCQVNGGGPFTKLSDVQRAQNKCQSSLIECYYGQPEEGGAKKTLVECVKSNLGE